MQRIDHLVALFAGEASGRGLKETLRRLTYAQAYLTNHPGAHVMFVRNAAGFPGEAGFSRLVCSRLPVQTVRIHVLDVESETTIDEIAAMDAFARSVGTPAVVALSSAYHLRRIQRMWERRHGRRIEIHGVPIAGWYEHYRACLEWLKRPLERLSPENQRALAALWRRF